jgi:hypothetical protein
MLAKADKKGEVWASIGGLAVDARVSREECQAALDVLLSPDPDSRTKDHDGRRIEAIDGGWRLLNYGKYHQLGKVEDRREYLTALKRAHRERNKSSLSANVSTWDQASAMVSGEPIPSESVRQRNREALAKAIRRGGLPADDKAVQEWADLLVGVGGCKNLNDALLAFRWITKRPEGATISYARQAKALAAKFKSQVIDKPEETK